MRAKTVALRIGSDGSEKRRSARVTNSRRIGI